MVDEKKTDDYTIEMDKMEQNKSFEPVASPPQPRGTSTLANNNSPILPVLAYCGSSILMTVMNKYVLSGTDFNLNFFLLCIQVCWGWIRGCHLICVGTRADRTCVWMLSLLSASSRFKHVKPAV